MNCYRTGVHADISWAALGNAAGYFERDGDTPRLLFCHTRDYANAVEAIDERPNLSAIEVIADANMPQEWWLLLGERTMVWSCP